MKKLLLTSLLSVAFSFSALAATDTATVTAEKTIAASTAAPTDKTEDKALRHKGNRQKITKEEKIAHRSQEVEAIMTTITENVKNLTGTDKIMAELSLAHAKLEFDAFKNPEIKTHAMSHLNKSHRYLKNADKYVNRGSKVEQKKEETAKK